MKFLQNNLTKLLNYLKVDKISLRIIDWFVTNYSKKYDSMYTLYDRNGKQLNPFNVFHSYKSQLKSYSKKFFDPFCRRNRIKYKYNDTDILSTTIGQLNFFRWAISNLITDYILLHKKEIEVDMNTCLKNMKLNGSLMKKNGLRKRRQELSLSATRGLSRNNMSVTLDFD